MNLLAFILALAAPSFASLNLPLPTPFSPLLSPLPSLTSTSLTRRMLSPEGLMLGSLSEAEARYARIRSLRADQRKELKMLPSLDRQDSDSLELYDARGPYELKQLAHVLWLCARADGLEGVEADEGLRGWLKARIGEGGEFNPRHFPGIKSKAERLKGYRARLRRVIDKRGLDVYDGWYCLTASPSAAKKQGRVVGESKTGKSKYVLQRDVEMLQREVWEAEEGMRKEVREEGSVAAVYRHPYLTLSYTSQEEACLAEINEGVERDDVRAMLMRLVEVDLLTALALKPGLTEPKLRGTTLKLKGFRHPAVENAKVR